MKFAAPPVVSVVLPVFNSAPTLTRAIASIRAQTFPLWELVVVDDGSTDDTSAIVNAIAADDPRVRLIGQLHQGIAAALNAGVTAAQARFIARMDADDESHPDRLERQIAFLELPENQNVGVVASLVEFGGDRTRSAGYALHVDWINTLVTPAQISLNRFVESPFAHPCVMFRRSLVSAHGGYGAGDFPEDYELWLRWLARGVTMAKIPTVLLRWNDHPARLSRIDARYAPEAFFRVKARYIAQWLAAEPNARSRPLFIWGAGRPTRKRAAHLTAHEVAIAGYIDVDPKKCTPAIGGTGLPVVPFDALPAPGKIFVLAYVTSRGAREWIHRELLARGYAEGRDFLMCA
jgi:glycosyltransferase involved in cell wall biosynthesis